MALLLDKKADPNQKAKNGNSPLLEAVMNGKLEAVRLLLQRGADVNQVDASGTSPLMVAAEGNVYIKAPEQMISSLLEHKAKLDLMDSQGRTALARATASNNAVAVKMLSAKQ
jgi:ankyrin repeat protein